MSTYHQHIIWESVNGKWSIGFFERINMNQTHDPDYDAEWDDDYNEEKFVFAKSGFNNPKQAVSCASKNYHPGYEEEPLKYNDDPNLCEKLDRMSISFENPELGEKLELDETEKLNQIHADKLSESFLNNNQLRRTEVVVYFKQDKNVYQKQGMSHAEHGYLSKKNNVLMLLGKPVFDLSTGRVAKNIHSIKKY